MFQTHQVHSKPENSRQKMWRYLSIERLCEIIENEELFFSHIKSMKDKWEGLLSKKTREKFFNVEYHRYRNTYNYDELKAIEAANGAIEQIESHKDRHYLNCWHMNDDESYLMWKVYGDKGCAVQTTYERIAESFGSIPPIIQGCVIKYIDYERDDFPIGNVFTQLGYKDMPYKDECEYRLIFWRDDLKNQEFLPEEKGIKIKVDVKMLVDNIYLSPIKNIDTRRLEQLVEEKGIDCKIINSKILESG